LLNRPDSDRVIVIQVSNLRGEAANGEKRKLNCNDPVGNIFIFIVEAVLNIDQTKRQRFI